MLALHLRDQQRLQLLFGLKPLAAALFGGGHEFALMLDFVFLHSEVVSLFGYGAVDVELLELCNLRVVAVVLRLNGLSVGVFLLLLLRLPPLGGDFQALRLRQVGMKQLLFVKLHGDAVHFFRVLDVIGYAGGVADTRRRLLLLAPVLFSGEFVAR